MALFIHFFRVGICIFVVLFSCQHNPLRNCMLTFFDLDLFPSSSSYNNEESKASNRGINFRNNGNNGALVEHTDATIIGGIDRPSLLQTANIARQAAYGHLSAAHSAHDTRRTLCDVSLYGNEHSNGNMGRSINRLVNEAAAHVEAARADAFRARGAGNSISDAYRPRGIDDLRNNIYRARGAQADNTINGIYRSRELNIFLNRNNNRGLVNSIFGINNAPGLVHGRFGSDGQTTQSIERAHAAAEEHYNSAIVVRDDINRVVRDLQGVTRRLSQAAEQSLTAAKTLEEAVNTGYTTDDAIHRARERSASTARSATAIRFEVQGICNRATTVRTAFTALSRVNLLCVISFRRNGCF